MQTNEKAPASAGKALNEALTETSGALISYPDCTTAQGKAQGRIAALLPQGEKNAISTLLRPYCPREDSICRMHSHPGGNTARRAR